jgi:toxin-antitoxin system PIN domain toxin
MTSLLDVNVLIALFDGAHCFHEAAHAWFASSRASGWASCPVTENGMVRVLSHPSYPGRKTTLRDAIERLAQFRASGHHVFWPDVVSICEPMIDATRVRGHRQITDVYLLALAVHRGGRLATFDRSIPLTAVTGATAQHLSVIKTAHDS